MPDWSRVRSKARELHASLADVCPGVDFPIPAARLIQEAERRLHLRCKPLPPEDPLLGGAFAALDRRERRIWYAGGNLLPRPLLNLILAHEFAHAVLHPDLEEDHFTPDQVLALDFGEDDTLEEETTLVGYSPAERRETEANIFAAELLLPCVVARKLSTEEGWRAGQIASAIGITEAGVHDQLMQALLLEAPLSDSEEREELSASAPALKLDTSQRLAAEIEHGPVLIDAGPGTGKTRTLIARILYLIRNRETQPEGILALTFSNRAAEEMRERLRAAMGEVADRVWIGTFHAFGYELLRKEGNVLGLPPRPSLLELVDAVALLERHLPLLNLREYEYLHQPGLPLPDMLSCISRAKDELKTPAMYRAAAEAQLAEASEATELVAARKALEVARVYEVYQQALVASGMLDFGDLLMRAVELLDRFPAVCRRLQAQYPHVLADEYQDINRASARLLQRLSGAGEGFWAVGDLRQSIYQFRGASPANVHRFEQDYPGGRRLRLDVNYRSRPHLVQVFGGVAAAAFVSDQPRQEAASAGGEATGWKSFREHAPHPSLTQGVAFDEEAQASALADRMRAFEREGYGLQTQVVLCATNAQAEEMAARLEAKGLPVQYLGGLLERPEVKDLLALLALATDPEGTALSRVATFAEYGIPAEDVQNLWRTAQARQVAFPAALKLGEEVAATQQGKLGLARLWRDLEPLLYRGDAATFLARYLFEARGYLSSLLEDQTASGRLKRLAVERLLHLARRSGHRNRSGSARERQAGFLLYLRALLQCGEAGSLRLPADSSGGEGVRLMTIHQSKGLEFPVVYLPNLNEGQFPFRRMGKMATPPKGLFDAAEEVAGEDETSADACLFFVALSRAQDHLVLSCTEKRRGKPVKPSSLLELLETSDPNVALSWERWNGVEETVVEEDVSAETATLNANSSRQETLPTVTLSALEMYRECPRKYFYRNMVGLPESRQDSAYFAFHEALTEVQNWIREERQSGRQPTLVQAKERFGRRHADRNASGRESGWTELLSNRAEELLVNVLTESAQERATLQDYQMIAELPNGRIRLRVESAALSEDGTLRLERMHRRGPKRDDHTDERLALWRYAAQQEDPQRPVEIALSYLATGEQRVVPPSARYEPARIERYDKALQGIRSGIFSASPDDQKCAGCPFLFVCPA